MNRTAYTYCVIRYVHDAGAGESLNVGVAVCAPDLPYFAVRVAPQYERLSSTFGGFDGKQYKAALRHFESAVQQDNSHLENSIGGLVERPKDVAAAVARIWPDSGLCFRLGPMLAGVTTDIAAATDRLFERMVTSQWAINERPPHRTDDAVWTVFNRPLDAVRVTSVLQPKTLITGDVEMEFPHAVRNGHWHVLQPLSFDYVNADSIQKKAAQWLGYGTGLQGASDLEKLYLLLGAPQENKHLLAYGRAKSLLGKMPIERQLVEEDEAEDFANALATQLCRHGMNL